MSAHHVAPLVHQHPARMVAVCQDLPRHADLGIPRVIRRTGQRRDLARGGPCASTLGANPCKPTLGKPTAATVPPNFSLRLAAVGEGASHFPSLSNASAAAAAGDGLPLGRARPSRRPRHGPLCALFLRG